MIVNSGVCANGIRVISLDFLGSIIYHKPVALFTQSRISKEEDNYMKKTLTISMIAGLIFMTSLVGCSSKPSTDEMKQLEDLKAEVASLEKEVSSKESEKAALQKAITDKDAQLAQCAKDREALQTRLKSK